MAEIDIQLLVRDPSVNAALASRIARAPGFLAQVRDAGFAPLPGSIILTTPSDCSPVYCAELVRDGVRVVLLAPVPRESDRAAYALAGGHFIPMQVDTHELFAALREAAGDPVSPVAE